MRKFYTVLLGLQSMFYYSQQTYFFDYYTNYKQTLKKHQQIQERDFQSLFNSKDSRYVLNFFKADDEWFADLEDYEKCRVYLFKIVHYKFPLNSDSFIFVSARDSHFSKKSLELLQKRISFSSEIIMESELIKKYKITNNLLGKKKKLDDDIMVEMQSYKHNILQGLGFALDFLQLHVKINFGENMIMKSSIRKVERYKIEIRYNLEALEEQNLTLTVNDKN